MVFSTDTLTTLTGLGTTVFGAAAYFGIFPTETAIAAGALHVLNSYFSKGITTKK
jgi:hypothetical protein